MLRLDTTTRSLEIQLAGVVTTNQLPVVVCYSDQAASTYSGNTQLAQTNNTTAVTICSAPAASTIRDIDYISVWNRDTVTATVIIVYNDNGTLYTVHRVSLSPNQQLQYTHGGGWSTSSTGGVGTLALDDLSDVTITTPSPGAVLTYNGTEWIDGQVDLADADAVTGALAATNGGTGFDSYTIGDLLYANTATTLAKLADIATGNALISGGVGAAPSWGKIGLTTHVDGVLPIANGGTNLSTAPTNGQLLIGNGTNYTLSTLTAGAGISVTNGVGSITIAVVGGASAPASAQYVTLALDGTLTAERVLTGTANQITITDGGANGNVTLAIANNPILPGTASVTIPTGTTAQRPGSPTVGMTRHNTTFNRQEQYEPNTWVRSIGILDKSTTTLTDTSINEVNVVDYTVPGGTMGIDTVLRITVNGELATTAGSTRTWTLRVRLNNTIIYQDVSVAMSSNSRAGFNVELMLASDNSALAQTLTGVASIGSLGAATTGITGDLATDELLALAIVSATSAINTAADMQIEVSWQSSGTSSEIVRRVYTIEKM